MLLDDFRRMVCDLHLAAGDKCIPDDLSVDSARDAILELQVHLRDGIFGENGSVRDIAYNSTREH